MNKSDLIFEICKCTDLPKDAVEHVVNCVFKIIRKSLVKGDKVQILGFGTFKVSHKAARTGRNPRTGEEIFIPAHKLPTFTAGKSLKEAVNQ